MPIEDRRPFIRIHNGMPEHPKIMPLPDAAFRALVELWCYSDRNATDGHIPERQADKYKRTALQALEKAGLVTRTDKDWTMHDYLVHQRSSADMATTIAKRLSVGSLGAHVRWHVNRGIVDAACPHCADAMPDADS